MHRIEIEHRYKASGATLYIEKVCSGSSSHLLSSSCHISHSICTRAVRFPQTSLCRPITWFHREIPVRLSRKAVGANSLFKGRRLSEAHEVRGYISTKAPRDQR